MTIRDSLFKVSEAGSKYWIFFKEGEEKLDVLIAPKTWISRLVAWLHGYKSYQDAPLTLAQKFCEVAIQRNLSYSEVDQLFSNFSSRIIKERTWWPEYKKVKSVFGKALLSLSQNLYWSSIFQGRYPSREAAARQELLLTPRSGLTTPSAV